MDIQYFHFPVPGANWDMRGVSLLPATRLRDQDDNHVVRWNREGKHTIRSSPKSTKQRKRQQEPIDEQGLDDEAELFPVCSTDVLLPPVSRLQAGAASATHSLTQSVCVCSSFTSQQNRTGDLSRIRTAGRSHASKFTLNA